MGFPVLFHGFVVVILTFFVGVWAHTDPPPLSQEVVYFEWRPPKGSNAVYGLPEKEDQHRIFLPPGLKKGGTYPVVVGFHGQPKQGKAPRNYKFVKNIPATVAAVAKEEQLTPFVFVMPVFRFMGQNWPDFDVRAFRKEVENQLKKREIVAGDWFAFGHSGAAGCGGDGLNQIEQMSPRAVGFFDTCLGRGWRRAIFELQKRGIETVNIHSVETAGFRPKQVPEYQSTFDFGRAYGPVGMSPVPCPKIHPGKRLRDQKYRCAATKDKVIQGFVVDSGEGQPAHEALLPMAIRYFLRRYIGRCSN
jgi:hypothetical protein